MAIVLEMAKSTLLGTFLLFLISELPNPTCGKSSKDLRSELRKNLSSAKVRPVVKATDQLVVQLNMAVQHIENIDEKQQIMTVSGFIPLSWHAETVKWNPTDYADDRSEGTKNILFRHYLMWIPQLLLSNSGKGNDIWKFGWSLPAHIYHDGTIYLSRFFTFTVTCSFDFKWYPYDTQRCPIVLGTWEHPLAELDLEFFAKTPWLRTYWPSHEARVKISGWEIVKLTHRKLYWTEDGLKTNLSKGRLDRHHVFPLAEFAITIKRHYPYYGLTLLLPCIITSFLTLASFWIKQVRIMIFVLFSNLIIIAVFLLDLVKALPPSSGGMPKIVHFYGFNLACTALAVIMQLIGYIMTVEDPDRKVALPPLMDKTVGSQALKMVPDYGFSFDNELYQPCARRSLTPKPMADIGPSSSEVDDAENKERPPAEEPKILAGRNIQEVYQSAKKLFFVLFFVAYISAIVLLLLI